MTENAPEPAKTEPAKKAAAKKAAARKTSSSRTPSKRQIIMVGKSRGAENGDRRTVDAERAEELVRAGLAKYPPNSKAAEKSGS